MLEVLTPWQSSLKLTARESSLKLSPGGHRQIRFEACSRKSTVYDFTTVRRNHCDARAAHRLDHSDPDHSFCVLFQPSRSNWIGRSRRAALCLDRARYGGIGRLGYSAALRKAVVRKTSASLLGRRDLLQALRPERTRSRCPLAKRDLCAAGNPGARMAGLAHLRRRMCALAAAVAAHKRRHDWLLARRSHGHAVRRHAHHRNGLRRRRAWAGDNDRKHANPPANPVARAHTLRLFPWPGCSGERSRRHYFVRRSGFLLGYFHQALA